MNITTRSLHQCPAIVIALLAIASPLAASAAAPVAPSEPTVPEPISPSGESEPAPAEPAPAEPARAEPEPTQPEPVSPTAEPEPTQPEPVSPTAEPESAQSEPEPAQAEPESAPAEPAQPAATTASDEVIIDGVRYRPAPGAGDPPYATPADHDALRQHHGLPTLAQADDPKLHRRVRWRCLIADPLCGTNVEINASTAYAYRLRQGNVRTGDVDRWHSSRVQYDLWVNMPVAFDHRGNIRVTRLTLGPKGGVALSDGGDVWANVGMAMRAWLGYGKYAPNIEVTSALTAQLAGQTGRRIDMVRRPIGVTLDVGFGLGGFGSIIVGGQVDPAFAREDIPEGLKTSASGMFFFGFRGNILWGAPAAAAVTTHALTQRYVDGP